MEGAVKNGHKCLGLRVRVCTEGVFGKGSSSDLKRRQLCSAHRCSMATVHPGASINPFPPLLKGNFENVQTSSSDLVQMLWSPLKHRQNLTVVLHCGA